MKYAIMSDVHANPAALEKALKDSRAVGCEKFILLGDITGYGYDSKGGTGTCPRELRCRIDGEP